MNRHILKSSALLLALVILPAACQCQITENLEIIFQKTYEDGAPPDSLWDWGRSIDCAGDVNNDGYADIIVAANKPFDDPLNPWIGKAYIFFGGDPIDTLPDVMLTGSKYGSAFIRVAGVGDFNSDGFDDVLLGQDAGDRAVRVFLGGSPMDTIADLILETRPGESVATDVADAGDVNGDSIDDCIIGDYLWNGTDGRALIFFGGSPPDTVPDVILSGVNNEGMGISVGGGGDLNGDGFADVVVGADANSEAAPLAGKVYGFFGGSPMDTMPDVWVRGEGDSHHLGWFGVDVVRNDSTFGWLVAGSRFFPNGFPVPSRGKIYIMCGGSIMDTLVDAHMLGQSDSSSLGRETSSAGNVDGVGMSDIVSCAPSERANRGATYLWLGQMPPDTVPDASATGEYSGHEAAWIAGCAGDVNRDARQEVIFCNYAAPILNHTVWVARYQSVGVSEKITEARKATVRILRTHPNPFSNYVHLVVGLTSGFQESVKIYDVRGNLCRTLDLPESPMSCLDTKIHSLTWDGLDDHCTRMPSGVYFARPEAPAGQRAAGVAWKLVLIRK